MTHTTLVPALVTQWLSEVGQRGRGPTSLRVLQAGGARLEPAPAAEAHKLLGCTVQQCYGMSEGLLTYTALDDPGDVIAHTQGRPASPGDEIRIVNEDGTVVAPGATGELLTRGPYTVAGYYAAPEADARAFTDDGFYRTGDLVRLHPSGGLVVEGRTGDVVNRGGEKISAGEIESLLAEHPLLRAVAAVAMPHPVWGQTVCVFAVPCDPEKQPTLLGLRRFLTEHGVATYKLPEELRVVDALPMIGVGKINRPRPRGGSGPAGPRGTGTHPMTETLDHDIPSFPMARACPMHPPAEYRELRGREPVSRVRCPTARWPGWSPSTSWPASCSPTRGSAPTACTRRSRDG